MSETNLDSTVENTSPQPPVTGNTSSTMVAPKNQIVLEPHTPASPAAVAEAQPAPAPTSDQPVDVALPSKPQTTDEVEVVSSQQSSAATGSRAGLIIVLLIVLGLAIGAYVALSVL